MEYHTTLNERYGGNIYDAWEFDLLWATNDGPMDWRKGRCTDMGHAVYAYNGSDRRDSQPCPFTDVEEVYAFDPSEEYGVPDHRELVRYYENWYRQSQSAHPEQVIPGGYYKTVMSGAIQAFGWDMLLLAAADQERFAKVLQRFGTYTAIYTQAWAETSIEVFIQHDDIVWTEGPFLHPDFYRQVIFPLYAQMWRPLRDAGKKILFCSDGKYDMFMGDIAACGTDGFIFEPVSDLDALAERFGQTHCLVGSKVDCRTMAFGTWEQVKAEMDATFAVARNCRGYIWAVGNHIPANVSDEMCLRYIDYLRANWKR